jgi:putative ABC transport system ATP-binding protein
MLEFENITRTFRVADRDATILRGITLHVGTREVVSIMGGSGSGKTTFMNIVGLLDKPTSGRYRIDGQDVLTADADRLSVLRNQLIGFVFQSLFLMPRLNVWRNVALPLFYRRTPLPEAKAQALAMLERVGLAAYADYMPNQVSGGMRQRVAIARALVGRPAVLLADEPTGALDVQAGQDIMDLFMQINRYLGVLIMIITHDPKIAAQCRRQLVLRAGVLMDETPLAAA